MPCPFHLNIPNRVSVGVHHDSVSGIMAQERNGMFFDFFL